MTMGGRVVLAAVGDVAINRAVPESMFASTGPILKAADITFGNCENSYSDVARDVSAGNAKAVDLNHANPMISHPRMAECLRSAAGFDVM